MDIEFLAGGVSGGELENHIDIIGFTDLPEQLLDQSIIHLLGRCQPEVQGAEGAFSGGLGAVDRVKLILVRGGLGVVGLGGGGGRGAGLVDDGLHLPQSGQLCVGGLQLHLQLLVGQILALDGQVGQGGVIGEEHIALLDGLTGVDQDLGDGLGVGEEEGLHLVGGDHAVALRGAGIVVGIAHHVHREHGDLLLGEPGDDQDARDHRQRQDDGHNGDPELRFLHGLPPFRWTGRCHWCRGGRRGCGRSCPRTGRCFAHG